MKEIRMINKVVVLLVICVLVSILPIIILAQGEEREGIDDLTIVVSQDPIKADGEEEFYFEDVEEEEYLSSKAQWYQQQPKGMPKTEKITDMNRYSGEGSLLRFDSPATAQTYTGEVVRAVPEDPFSNGSGYLDYPEYDRTWSNSSDEMLEDSNGLVFWGIALLAAAVGIIPVYQGGSKDKQY